ncbi:hypothetical protein C7444_108173 [Sphaerotilus hippei]|uniref:Metalloprotease n=1 Tax=Sphaerotilus hippei TaxID=744406 RepID=A0A318GZU7_9BURK|nr:neutral zinc metallopeptidase [Sphaerotilus hippei]PXW95913.1 hypothetical protein C7444_108173 [Sphaerotilus hippei]
MKWDGQRESDQIEDRRGGGSHDGGGRRTGLPLGGGKVGLGTVAVALIAGWIFGINPLTLLGLLGGGGESGYSAPATTPSPGAVRAPVARDEATRFVSTVLASTEDVWSGQFSQSGGSYRKPVLVLFRGSTRTACGQGEAAMGPFYCPGDQKVYLDLDFFDVMRQRLGAPGDFAQAYVIAHEVGHHVQQLAGISDKVESARRRAGEAQANALSVRLELQADCFAGIWAHDSQQARQWLDQGDVEEALNAASKIGDDTLQSQSGGPIVPENFTHGSSAQRVRWFRRGMEGGRVADCNTFEARSL